MNGEVKRQVMPIIAVASVDEIRDFYVGKLGFQHLMGVVGKDGEFDFCTVVRDGARIMFTRSAHPANEKRTGEVPKQPVELYLEVADVDALYQTLKKTKHVKISDALTTQWWGDRTFKVVDPCGYEIWFYETVDAPKPPDGAKIV